MHCCTCPTTVGPRRDRYHRSQNVRVDTLGPSDETPPGTRGREDLRFNYDAPGPWGSLESLECQSYLLGYTGSRGFLLSTKMVCPIGFSDSSGGSSTPGEGPLVVRREHDLGTTQSRRLPVSNRDSRQWNRHYGPWTTPPGSPLDPVVGPSVARPRPLGPSPHRHLRSRHNFRLDRAKRLPHRPTHLSRTVGLRVCQPRPVGGPTKENVSTFRPLSAPLHVCPDPPSSFVVRTLLGRLSSTDVPTSASATPRQPLYVHPESSPYTGLCYLPCSSRVPRRLDGQLRLRLTHTSPLRVRGSELSGVKVSDVSTPLCLGPLPRRSLHPRVLRSVPLRLPLTRPPQVPTVPGVLTP